MTEIPSEWVEAAAKAAQPYLWQRETFIDNAGTYWSEKHKWCQNNARRKARAALAAVLPLVMERERERRQEMARLDEAAKKPPTAIRRSKEDGNG